MSHQNSTISSDRRLMDQPPDLRFDGRVAWVTGASRGLGRSLAYAFAGAGAQVVLSARSPAALVEVSDQIQKAGGKALVLTCSVDDADEVNRAAQCIEREIGHLDILVNNAGISPHFKRAEQVRHDELRSVIDTNLIGPFTCGLAALPLLEASASASVVNISSVHGSRAYERLLPYSVSKGALEMLTRTLAVEWASRGIRVNSLAPGYLETEMTAGLLNHPRWGEQLRTRTPLGRFGKTEELVGCAMFLASAAASYVTGATLFADGGWSAL